MLLMQSNISLFRVIYEPPTTLSYNPIEFPVMLRNKWSASNLFPIYYSIMKPCQSWNEFENKSACMKAHEHCYAFNALVVKNLRTRKQPKKTKNDECGSHSTRLCSHKNVVNMFYPLSLFPKKRMPKSFENHVTHVTKSLDA